MREHWRVAVPLLLLALAAAAPLILSGYSLNLLARFLSLAILGVGLVLIWGHGGILSLGQGVLFGLGGYAIAMHMKLAGLGEGALPDFMLWSGQASLPGWWVPFRQGWFAVAAVLVLPALVGALLAWAMFRRRVGGTYFAIITQALALAFATFLISRQDVTGGFNGLTGFTTLFGLYLSDPSTGRILYWLTLALLALAWAGVSWLIASRFGLLLGAMRQGENRVRFLGYDPTPFRVAAFALAALLAGVSGALFTLHAGVVSPAMVGVVPSIEMVIMVAVGGRYSPTGAIAGALLVNYARDIVSSSFPDLWLYLLGALFIAVVTFLPDGLAGLVRRRR